MKKLILLGSLIIIALLAGCRPSTITNENKQKFNNYILVEADNNYQLTADSLYEKLYDSRLLKNGGVLDTQTVRAFIDSLVVDTLMGFEAQGIDIRTNYEMKKIFYLRYYDELIRKYLDLNVYGKVTYDSLEAVKFYYDNPDLFKIEEASNLYHIFVTPLGLLKSDDSMIYKAMDEVQLDSATKAYTFDVYNQIGGDFEKFKELATKYSHDSNTNKKQGYLGWCYRQQYLDPFDSVAFALNDNEVSEPYQDKNGWHILYCEKHYLPGLQDINPPLYLSAVNTLKTKKANELGQELFDSIFVDYKVVYNDSLLDKNIFLYPGELWLATINDVDTIDINEAKSLESSYRRRLKVEVTTPEQKKEYLRKQGQKYVLAQYALKDKLDTLPDIAETRVKLWQKYARQLLDEKPYDLSWQPNDSMIKAYYDSHLDEFKSEKPLVVQHIVVQDSVFGEFIRDQALSGIDFMDLAREYYPGEENIRHELADLGAIGRNDVAPEFFEAALHLQPGDVSHPVKTQYGYHVIKMIERKDNLTLSQARYKIVPILKEAYRTKLFDDYRDKMYQKYHVQYTKKPLPVHLKPKNIRLNEKNQQLEQK